MKKGLVTLLFAAFMIVFMVPALQAEAADTGRVDTLSVSWIESGEEITASYNYDTDEFTYSKWDKETDDVVSLDTMLPEGVYYDKGTGTLTLNDAVVDTIFYRGTADLNIHIIGTSSFEMLKVFDGKATVRDPETGEDINECYHGGDIFVYGDGKGVSTLNFDWIWQDTDVGSLERLEPDADDGDVGFMDLTLNGNMIESAISNLTFTSCNVTLKGKTGSDGYYNAAYIAAGGSPSEYENPEGILSVKNSVIELSGSNSYLSFLEFDSLGEYFYLGQSRPENEFDFANNWYKDRYGYYYTGGAGYILITPEAVKLPDNLYGKAVMTLSQDSFTYTGKEIKPAVTVTYEGKVLKEGVDYTLSYNNNVNVGNGTVVANGINDYRSYVATSFQIVEAPAAPKIVPAEIRDLSAVKISKAKAAKKAATVNWKKISKKNLKKIKKVQIQYSTDKTFKKGVKTKYASAKKTSYKIKGLKSKKTYYVRIRAYTKNSTGVHVSKWSSVKKIKAK